MLTPSHYFKSIDPVSGLVNLICVQCGTSIIVDGTALVDVLITANGAMCLEHETANANPQQQSSATPEAKK